MNSTSEIRWDPIESILAGASEEKLLERGDELYRWLSDLFPVCRSLTGNGVRQTISYFQRLLPGLQIHEVPSGTAAFDWTVPAEWNIRAAWIKDSQGKTVVDFAHNNLHVVGYSIPVQATLSLDELQPHLHTLPEQPDAIPYITSYYKPYWGFCLTERQRATLGPGEYTVCIDSTLEPGSLTYADLVIPGKSAREVFLSTYVCHPSLANNELSGPVIMAAIGQYLLAHAPHLEYTYRLVFIPETIGSIVYLSRHLEHLQKQVVAGFNLTCLAMTSRIPFFTAGTETPTLIASHRISSAPCVRTPNTTRTSRGGVMNGSIALPESTCLLSHSCAASMPSMTPIIPHSTTLISSLLLVCRVVFASFASASISSSTISDTAPPFSENHNSESVVFTQV